MSDTDAVTGVNAGADVLSCECGCDCDSDWSGGVMDDVELMRPRSPMDVRGDRAGDFMALLAPLARNSRAAAIAANALCEKALMQFSLLLHILLHSPAET